MDCSSPGSSVHGILQARILEWVAISFSRGSSQPRDQTWLFCIVGRFFTVWDIREAPKESPADTKENPHYLVMWTDFFLTFYNRTPYFSSKIIKGLSKSWNWEMHCLQNLKVPRRCLACFKFMSAKRFNNCFLSVRMASVYLIIFRNATFEPLCYLWGHSFVSSVVFVCPMWVCQVYLLGRERGCLHYNV